ncbi:protein ABHD11-like [Hyposmocoma kahamanoa]|uniref:protein ABHD11-like n=1 Tax=Hyposmocoma kahamanoa TaxID=1477025 RepID=UPI000E6D7CB0|nr:protein ABHD11-like [Hyposmocoma kahamanoa]
MLQSCISWHLIRKSVGYPTVKRFLNLSYKVVSESSSENPDLPPVLLLHGLLGQKKLWACLGKTIATVMKHSVLTVDLRNHGVSPHHPSHKYEDLAEDVVMLMNKLKINRAVLIGHNMGGRTSMSISLMAAERIAGLIIVDISPVSNCKQLAEDMLIILKTMKSIHFDGLNTRKRARTAARIKLHTHISDSITLNAVLKNIDVRKNGTIGWICNLDALLKNFNHIVSFFPAHLQNIQYNGPVLFIGGQRSDFIPPDDLPDIRSIFPNVVVTYITGAGHNVHAHDPRAFLELVIQFLKKNKELFK